MPHPTPNAANAARACFNHNKKLNTVFVTTDGACFAQRNHAINHARTLQLKTVEVFEREVEAEAVSPEPKKPLKVKKEVALDEGTKSKDTDGKI